MFRIHREWALAFTVRAITDSDLLGRILVEWSQDRPTFPTVELDILELWEYTCTSSHDARHTDKVVEICSAEVSQRRAEGEIGDANMYLGVNAFVGGVVHQDGVESDFVEDSKHRGGGISQEVGENWFRHGQVQIRHLEGLGVI